MFSLGDSMEIEISPATPEKEWSPGPEVNSDFFYSKHLVFIIHDYSRLLMIMTMVKTTLDY